MRATSYSRLLRSGIAVGVLAAALLAGPVANAVVLATSVGTDISVAGNLTVNGNTTLGAAASNAVTVNGALAGANPLVFEGATVDGNKTTFAITDPTSPQTITIPNATGTLVLDTAGQTLSNKTLTAPTVNGGSLGALTNLGVRDLSAAFDVILAADSSTPLSANRTLTFDLGNADRLLRLGGSLSTANDFATSGNFALTLTQTGATNVTLPTTGTLATLAGTEVLSNKTLSSPKITSGIFDANGNGLLEFTANSTPVNFLQITNANTGGNPILNVGGADTNIGMDLWLKGTGALIIGSTTANSDTIDIAPNTAGAAPFGGTITSADLTAARTWTFPDADITVNAAANISGTTLASNVVGSSLTSVGTLSSLAVAGDLTADTTTLHVDSGTHRVGIGTTGPTQMLDVFGGAGLTDIAVGSTYSTNGTSPGGLQFYGNNSVASPTTYAAIAAIIDDNTNGAEKGKITFLTQNSGSMSPKMALDENGDLTVDGSVTVGSGGTPIVKHISTTVVEDIAATAGASSCAFVDATVTGAALGDSVTVAPQTDDAAWNDGTLWARATAADTVRIVYCSAAAAHNPASMSYRVDVWKH